MDQKTSLQQQIEEIEKAMAEADFWQYKERAKAMVAKYESLKAELERGPVKAGGEYDAGSAVMTIFSGAGGDDAEDFTKMLFSMYRKYAEKRGWSLALIDENQNDHGGYRNISFEVKGRGVYGELKNESGVHRLVRQSPFNSKSLRQTSFSLVEVIPDFSGLAGVGVTGASNHGAGANSIFIPDSDIEVTYARSSGPGGQNVNKRETAVRIVHLPTKLSVHVQSERSQAQNKQKALDILRGKIYKMQDDERRAKEKGLYISKTTSIDWGNQIRSYVLHPYKLVKDHRTDVEVHDAESVLEGKLEKFIESERDL